MGELGAAAHFAGASSVQICDKFSNEAASIFLRPLPNSVPPVNHFDDIDLSLPKCCTIVYGAAIGSKQDLEVAGVGQEHLGR